MMTKKEMEQWEKLYKIGEQIKNIAPWKIHWDTDIFAVTFEGAETAYFTIFGRAGYQIGISIYHGIKGLNDLMGIINSERLNLPVEYVMMIQNNFTMYIGNRDEVSDEQYKVIKELGLKFRKNANWIYFEVFEKGYWPYIPNNEEVIYGIKYMEKLIEALFCYQNNSFNVDFENGEMFEYYEKNGVWEGKVSRFPLYGYQYPVVTLTDKQLKKQQQKKTSEKRNQMIIEADLFPTQIAIEEGYKKPALPCCAVLADHKSGLILSQRMTEPDDVDFCLAKLLADWILASGIPRKIIIENEMILGLINDVCSCFEIEVCCGEIEAINTFKEQINNDELPDKEEMKQLLSLMKEEGFDLLSEMNEDMTEEELYENIMSIMPQMTEMLNDRLIEGEPFDNSFQPKYFRQELKNQKQKIEAVKEYYGMGEIPDDIYEEYEKDVIIEYGEDTWRERLLENKKEDLLAIAKELNVDVKSSYSKKTLISSIQEKAVLEPSDIKRLLGKEEQKLFNFLKRKAGALEKGIAKDDFHFSMEAVLRLLTLGFIDIEYGCDEDGLILEIFVTEEIVNFILKQQSK